MKKYTIVGYKFNELSAKAKEKALEKFRYASVDFCGWSDYILADFCNNLLPKYGIFADKEDISWSEDSYGRINVKLNIKENSINIMAFFKKCNLELPHYTLWEKWHLADRCLEYDIKGRDFRVDVRNYGYNSPMVKWFDNHHSKIADVMSDLLQTMEKQIKNEIEYRTSDVYVGLILEDNEYMFTEQGEVLPACAFISETE